MMMMMMMMMIYNNIKRDNLYITLTDFNKFTKDILDEKIKK